YGKTLATAGTKIKIWDLSGEKPTPRGECRVSHNEGCNAFAFGRDRIAASEQGGGTHLWDLPGNQDPPRELAPKLKTGAGLTPYTLAFSPDGKLLCLGSQSGSHLWTLNDKGRKEPAVARHAAAGHVVGRAAFTPDGKIIVTAYRFDS